MEKAIIQTALGLVACYIALGWAYYFIDDYFHEKDGENDNNG